MKKIIKIAFFALFLLSVPANQVLGAGVNVSLTTNQSTITPATSITLTSTITTDSSATLENCTLTSVSNKLGGSQTTPSLTQTNAQVVLPDGSVKKAQTSYGSAGMESILFDSVTLTSGRKLIIKSTVKVSKQVVPQDIINTNVSCFANGYSSSNQLQITVKAQENKPPTFTPSPSPAPSINSTPAATIPPALTPKPDQNVFQKFWQYLQSLISKLRVEK